MAPVVDFGVDVVDEGREDEGFEDEVVANGLECTRENRRSAGVRG
jgi:hypothetical protein